ncbi:hypothetical protein VPH35_114174 [Triticum aestivum]
MADCKRRCVDVADRLGDLPDSLLQVIISLLGFRQAVQTGVLSRRWKNLWRGMPVVDIDEREFAGDGQTWDRFEDFVDHASTSIPPGTRLDAFRLHVVSCDTATSSRWIRRGLSHLPAAVSIHGTNTGHSMVWWNPHVSSPPRSPFRYAAADGLWQQRGMSACAAGFTRRLTTLRLVGAGISRGFFEELGRNCPTLQELHTERCMMRMLSLVSPVLRRLAVIAPISLITAAVVPGLEAPRLASLRLDIMYCTGARYATCTHDTYACFFEAPPITTNRRKEMASSECHGSTTPTVFWCKKLKSIEIKCTKEDETHLARVLSEISKGMAPEQWEQVKTSDTIVSAE